MYKPLIPVEVDEEGNPLPDSEFKVSPPRARRARHSISSSAARSHPAKQQPACAW